MIESVTVDVVVLTASRGDAAGPEGRQISDPAHNPNPRSSIVRAARLLPFVVHLSANVDPYFSVYIYPEAGAHAPLTGLGELDGTHSTPPADRLHVDWVAVLGGRTPPPPSPPLQTKAYILRSSPSECG